MLMEEKETEKSVTEERYKIFPWADVDRCMENVIEPEANGKSCPVCGKPSEQLHWIDFRSPQWTWENLCGRRGFMSICKECRCQVEFWCISMN